MNNLRIERVNYFTGEALLTADFECEQRYQMEMLAANNLSLNTWGIAQGLEVAAPVSSNTAQARQIQVAPGMAIDALGRQIILLETRYLSLQDLDTSATWFIAIRYHDVYADLSDASGTPGYKRIVQQPEVRFLRNLDQPGLNILLAVLSLTTSGEINQLSYQSGRNQRQYVGAKLGSVNFITEGYGVNASPSVSSKLSDGSASLNLLAKRAIQDNAASRTSISAKRATDNSDYLEFATPRGQFNGLLTTRSNLGIGIDQPLANLQLQAITFKGSGTLSTNGTLVTFSNPPNPFFQIGDLLTSDATLSTGRRQQRVIVKVDAQHAQVTVDAAFDPALNGIPYTFIRSTLARFNLPDSSSVFQLMVDGSVGLGVQSGVKQGSEPGPNTLLVTPQRQVGIALSSGLPRGTLDVNGPIYSTGLISSGAVKAQSFEGNGSKLQGLSFLSYWTKDSPGANYSSLYYNSGNVGIFDTKPEASLSVGGGHAFIGHGVITSFDNYTIEGYNTTFQDQIKVGDLIAIGTLIEQRATLASKPTSDTQLTLETQFEVPVLNSPYSIIPAGGGDAVQGAGTVSSNGTLITGSGTTFSSLNAGDVLSIPRFYASGGPQQSQTVDTVVDATHLTLSAAFTGEVKDLPFTYQDAEGKVQTGTGTISALGKEIIGKGTTFDDQIKKLYTYPVQENQAGFPQKWAVKSIDSQTQLTLYKPDDGSSPNFTAATSSYMVSTGLLAKFKANDSNAIVPPEQLAILPPALMVLTNSDFNAPNTVTINVEQGSVNRDLALQVVGDVSFTGGHIDFGDLTVDTLFAKKSVAVGSTAIGNALLTVATSSSKPQMLITPSNVLLGQSSPSAANALLDIAGNAQVSGNIGSAQAVQASQLNASQSVSASSLISSTQGTLQGNTLLGAQLNVTGLNINNSGQVQFLATPAGVTIPASSIKDSGETALVTSRTVNSDGLLFAMVGALTYDRDYMGVLTATSRRGETLICSMSASGSTIKRTFDDGKKGSKTYHAPIPGCFTLPLNKGDAWSLSIVTDSHFGKPPDVYYYWVPLGYSSTPPTFVTVPPAPAPLPTPAPAPTPSPSSLRAASSAATEIASATASRLLDSASPDAIAPADLPPDTTEIGAAAETAASHAVPDAAANATAHTLENAATSSVENMPENAAAAETPASTTAPAPAAADADAGLGQPHPAQVAEQALQAMREQLAMANSPQTMLASAQVAINQRVQDLTNILGDATGMQSDAAARESFIRDLQKIVCSPAEPQRSLDQQAVDDLINTFGQITGHTFSAEQRGLLDAGVKALVAINDSPATRDDLQLIKNNIDLFLGNMQQVLGSQFSSQTQRLLTRALMRLVGDGRQGQDLPSAASIARNSGASVSADQPNAELHASLGQEIESALGQQFDQQFKPLLPQLINSVVQGLPLSAQAGALVQKVTQMLPQALDESAKQVLQDKLNQALTQHSGKGFVGEVEQILQQTLQDSDKQGLHSTIHGMISGQQPAAQGESSLWETLKNTGREVLEDKAKTLLGKAIGGLLGRIF